MTKASIEEMQNHILKSISESEKGKTLAHQSYENYITELLDMEIVSSENLGDKDSYQDEFKIVAKSKKEGFNAEYVFIGKYYDFQEFNPRENRLFLIEIRGEEGVYETEKTMYFNNLSGDDFNSKQYILNTPLKELLSGVQKDKELEFVVDLLIKTFENTEGYKYSEENVNDKSSFRIVVENKQAKIIISKCFSNGIQFSFLDIPSSFNNFRSSIVIFREVKDEKLIREIAAIKVVSENFLNKNITIDEKHSLKEITDFLAANKVHTGLTIDNFVKENAKGKVTILHDFVIDPNKNDNYDQVEANLKYDYDEKHFILSMIYLFKNYEVTCESVDDFKNKFLAIENMLKPAQGIK